MIMFGNRKLKITSQYVRSLYNMPIFKPKITISGNWLKEAGFEIGQNVSISVNKNELIIKKITNE